MTESNKIHDAAMNLIETFFHGAPFRYQAVVLVGVDKIYVRFAGARPFIDLPPFHMDVPIEYMFNCGVPTANANSN